MWALICGQTESLFSHKLCYNTNYYISSPGRRISIPSPINGHSFETAHLRMTQYLIPILTFASMYLKKQDRIIDEIYGLNHKQMI